MSIYLLTDMFTVTLLLLLLLQLSW